jgi:predicted Zn-dependent peptidase
LEEKSKINIINNKLINEKSQTDLSGFYVVFNGSVLNETTKTYGVSHLVEHLKCKMFNHLYDDFSRYSIQWNAYTNDTEVVFYMTGLDEYVNKYKREFLDCLMKFDIPLDEFETERNVVIQEYKDVFDEQIQTLYYNTLREQYHQYGAIGKLKSIKSIKYKDVLKFHNKYYSKPSKIINVSKHNDFTDSIEFNTDYKSTYVVDSKDKLAFEKGIKYNKSAIIGFIKTTEDFNYISFVLDMLCGSLTSPFVNEIREKRGLTYNVSSGIERISDEQGFILTYLVTTPDKVDEVLETYKMILSNGSKYLTKEIFDIQYDKYIISKRKSEIERYKNIKKFITPESWLFSTIENDITFEKTIEIFNKYLTFDKWTWKIN